MARRTGLTALTDRKVGKLGERHRVRVLVDTLDLSAVDGEAEHVTVVVRAVTVRLENSLTMSRLRC
jgi:hypothetical protein